MPGEERAGYVPIERVFQPPALGGGTFTGWLSLEGIQESLLVPWRYENVFIARRVLQDPDRVYRGTDPENMEEGFSYIWQRTHPKTGEVRFVYRGKGLQADGQFERTPFKPEHLFTAFLTPNRVLLDWRQEPHVPSDPRRPIRPPQYEGTLIWDRP